MDAGACPVGIPDCCRERVLQNLDLVAGSAGARWYRLWCACGRWWQRWISCIRVSPGSTAAAADGGPAGRAGRDRCGDGIHRGLLVTGVSRPRRGWRTRGARSRFPLLAWKRYASTASGSSPSARMPGPTGKARSGVPAPPGPRRWSPTICAAAGVRFARLRAWAKPGFMISIGQLVARPAQAFRAAGGLSVAGRDASGHVGLEARSQKRDLVKHTGWPWAGPFA
jgi:hypothetical protein